MHYPFNEIKTILKLPHQELKSPSFIYDVTLLHYPFVLPILNNDTRIVLKAMM